MTQVAKQGIKFFFFFYRGTGPEGGQALLGGFPLPRSQLGMSASNLG